MVKENIQLRWNENLLVAPLRMCGAGFPACPGRHFGAAGWKACSTKAFLAAGDTGRTPVKLTLSVADIG